MIEIIKLDKSKLIKVKGLLSTFKYKTYQYLANEISNEKVDNYLFNQIIASLSNELSVSYVAIRDDEIVGLGTLEQLPWDSDIFKIKMARISNLIADKTSLESESVEKSLLKVLFQECNRRDIKHLSCKVNTNNISTIHVLEKSGFKLMDTLLNYVFDFRKYSVKDFTFPFIIRPAEKNDVNYVVDVARKSFSNHFGRFQADKKLNKMANQLYAKWAENAFHGYGDIILVAELDKKIVGYSVWKLNKLSEKTLGIGIGDYSICGVHPDAHGKGIFKALTNEGMKLLSGKVDIIEGPTHINNYPVQRGYETLSWKIVNAIHTFHKYLRH